MRITLTTDDEITVKDEAGNNTITITPHDTAEVEIDVEAEEVVEQFTSQELIDVLGAQEALNCIPDEDIVKHTGVGPLLEVIGQAAAIEHFKLDVYARRFAAEEASS